MNIVRIICLRISTYTEIRKKLSGIVDSAMPLIDKSKELLFLILDGSSRPMNIRFTCFTALCYNIAKVYKEELYGAFCKM